MSKSKNKFEVLTIKIFLDENLHLSGDVDINANVFNEEKTLEVMNDLLQKLYKCGTGEIESEEEND